MCVQVLSIVIVLEGFLLKIQVIKFYNYEKELLKFNERNCLTFLKISLSSFMKYSWILISASATSLLLNVYSI